MLLLNNIISIVIMLPEACASSIKESNERTTITQLKEKLEDVHLSDSPDESSQDESDYIESDIESTDVSSVEMTDTETSDEDTHDQDDHMSVDSDTDETEDKAFEEIRYYQRTTHDIIPFENFKLLVQEIMQDYNTELDIDDEAVKAMQAATESYLVELFEKTQRNAIHGGRQVITPKDLQLARYHAKERD